MQAVLLVADHQAVSCAVIRVNAAEAKALTTRAYCAGKPIRSSARVSDQLVREFNTAQRVLRLAGYICAA